MANKPHKAIENTCAERTQGWTEQNGDPLRLNENASEMTEIMAKHEREMQAGRAR